MDFEVEIVKGVFLNIYVSAPLLGSLHRFQASSKNPELVDTSPLAQRIFKMAQHDVSQVDIDPVHGNPSYKSCISIRNLYKGWNAEMARDMTKIVLMGLQDFTRATKPPINEEAYKAAVEQRKYVPQNPNDPIQQYLAVILNEEILPVIHQHGGTLDVTNIDDKGPGKDVFMTFHLKGACEGCSSSEKFTMNHAFRTLNSMFVADEKSGGQHLQGRKLGGIIVYEVKDLSKPAFSIPESAAQYAEPKHVAN